MERTDTLNPELGGMQYVKNSLVSTHSARTLAMGLALAILTGLTGCQSMSDGARQVSLGARDLGKRMAEPFRRSPSQPSFGQRSPGAAGDRDPFLPPPKRPDADETSYIPRHLDTVTLGKPMFLPRPTP